MAKPINSIGLHQQCISWFSILTARAIHFPPKWHTGGSGYFKQLLSALAATPKTHLHTHVSSDHDSAAYVGSLSRRFVRP